MKELEKEVSKLRDKLLTERRKKKAVIEATKAEVQIKIERLTIPKSRLGRFILDMVLTVEKYT